MTPVERKSWNQQYHDCIREQEDTEQQLALLEKLKLAHDHGYTSFRKYTQRDAEDLLRLKIKLEQLKAKARRIDQLRADNLTMYAKHLSLCMNYLNPQNTPRHANGRHYTYHYFTD